MTETFLHEWEDAFGFTCVEEKASAYAAIGERLVWVPESELSFEEVAASAKPGSVVSVVYQGRAGCKWPMKGLFVCYSPARSTYGGERDHSAQAKQRTDGSQVRGAPSRKATMRSPCDPQA